jgi:L-rhamnose mutarotase
METTYKRYCKILTLRNDLELIRKYTEIHSIGKAWPEVTQGMKDVGIIDMEIYIKGNILFMIMDTTPGFDHEVAMKRLAQLPRQKEWETYVSQFQNSNSDSAEEKWTIMERIYELDQEKYYEGISGQKKHFKG